MDSFHLAVVFVNLRAGMWKFPVLKSPESTQKPTKNLCTRLVCVSYLQNPILTLQNPTLLFAKMTSLSLRTKFSLTPNSCPFYFHSPIKLGRINFPKSGKIKIKVTCSATDQPRRRQQQQQKYLKKKRSASEAEKGVDPVGFLMKLGITHKAFAQFLRER